MILIDAIYIHESGGKTLLEYFIRNLTAKTREIKLILDERLSSEYIESLELDTTYHKPTERARRECYENLNKNINRVFCFANVPPPITIDRNIIVFIFFHNALLLAGLFENLGYGIKNKLIFLSKSVYISLKNQSHFKWIVQTESVKRKLCAKFGIFDNKTFVTPFFEEEIFTPLVRQNKKNGSFLYVADGVQQKNHLILLRAWEILYTDYNIEVELNLTVPPKYLEIDKRISQLKSLGVPVKNHSRCGLSEIKRLYYDSEYLIFPSLIESFGLPLVEAIRCGCKIISSDLPYVHDVVKPTATFNPYSARDIAAKVVEIVNGGDVFPSEIAIKNEIDSLIGILTKDNVYG